jgi:hypothetical protein
MRFIPSSLIACAGITLGLSGCKSDNTAGTTTPTTDNAVIAGLWGGTDADSGDTLNVLISSTNQMVVIRSDGVQFAGLIEVSGDTIVAAIDGYANFGTSFSDSSVYGIGTLNGTVVPSASIAATIGFTTNGDTSVPGSWNLTPGSLTKIGSSLATVAGSFTDATTGATVTITASGTITSTNPATGCVLDGTIGTNDASIDVYQVAYKLENCTGDYAALNGITYTGLGYVDNTASPLKLTYAVSGSASSADNFGIVSSLTLATT